MMREAVDKAAEQAMRAGQIIRRLRDFVARGESERQVESIAKLIEEASALALVGAKDRASASASISIRGNDLVLADKVQIQQVLLNLIRNAIEAMDGSPVRELTVSAGRGQDDMMTVSVADTGAGIAQDIAPTAVPALHDHQARRNGRRACRFAARSSKLTAAGFGPNPIPVAAPSSDSPCER